MDKNDVCRVPSIRVLPSVYADELSYYEKLSILCKKINELIELFNSQTETYATIEQLEKSQNEQDARIAKQLHENYNSLMGYVRGEIKRLEILISDIVSGQVTTFDPTYGIKPRPIDEVVRNVYHWLRYYADYANVFDSLNMTAETRDNFALKAREFDLYSMLYYSKSDKPEPGTNEEYVKKHDISAYYFERPGIKEEEYVKKHEHDISAYYFERIENNE